MRAHAPADPVALHGQHALGPARGQGIQTGQQFVGIVRDTQKPLLQVLLLDLAVAAPAAAFDDLLVRQHRMAGRAPVLGRTLAVYQPLLEKLQEEKLLEAVVFGIAGGNFAAPVIGIPHAPQLGAHVFDVFARPLGRMNAVLDGRVLGRHSEGVPAHGMQHVVSVHALEPGDNVANGIVAYVPHVDTSRGIREHLQDVVFGAGRIDFAMKHALFFPDALPFGLYMLRIVTLHDSPVRWPDVLNSEISASTAT